MRRRARAVSSRTRRSAGRMRAPNPLIESRVGSISRWARWAHHASNTVPRAAHKSGTSQSTLAILLAGSAVQRASDFGGERLEPRVVLEQQVEVQEVVRLEGRTDPRFGEFRRQAPDLHAHATGDEQVDDASARLLGDCLPAVRAAEAVRTPFVVGAHADREVLGSQLYVTATGAVGPDRGHRVTRPWSASCAVPNRHVAVIPLRQGPRGA